MRGPRPGVYDQPDRGTAIFNEWGLNTAEKIKERDAALYELLTEKEYALPTILPDGNYNARSSQNKRDFKVITLTSNYNKNQQTKSPTSTPQPTP